MLQSFPVGLRASGFRLGATTSPEAWSPESDACLHRLLLRDRALPRTFAGARVGAGPLAVNREIAPVPHAAVAADLHQPLDVHGDLLAEIAFHPTLLFDHSAD